MPRETKQQSKSSDRLFLHSSQFTSMTVTTRAQTGSEGKEGYQQQLGMSPGGALSDSASR